MDRQGASFALVGKGDTDRGGLAVGCVITVSRFKEITEARTDASECQGVSEDKGGLGRKGGWRVNDWDASRGKR